MTFNDAATQEKIYLCYLVKIIYTITRVGLVIEIPLYD